MLIEYSLPSLVLKAFPKLSNLRYFGIGSSALSF